MKIRTGFVSNSSSSSFLIYGCVIDQEYVDNEKIEEAIELVRENRKDKKLSLYFRCPEGYDQYYLGLSYTSIGEDETKRQFKERTEKLVNEVVEEIRKINIKEGSDSNFKIEFGTHQETYYC